MNEEYGKDTDRDFVFPPRYDVREFDEGDESNFYYGKSIHVPEMVHCYRYLESRVAKLRKENKGWDSYPKLFLSGAWYQVALHSIREKNSSYAYRGYIQINPLDLPFFVSTLTKLIGERLIQGKRTEFKISLNPSSMVLPKNKSGQRFRKEHLDKVGHYNVSPSDSGIIVIYGEDIEETKEILRELSQVQGMQHIDARQKAAVSNLEEKKEPLGKGRIAIDGNDFSCMSYNLEPGHWDDQLDDSYSPEKRAKFVFKNRV